MTKRPKLGQRAGDENCGSGHLSFSGAGLRAAHLIRIRTSVRFSSTPAGFDPAVNPVVTKGRIASPSFGGLLKAPCLYPDKVRVLQVPGVIA